MRSIASAKSIFDAVGSFNVSFGDGASTVAFSAELAWSAFNFFSRVTLGVPPQDDCWTRATHHRLLEAGLLDDTSGDTQPRFTGLGMRLLALIHQMLVEAEHHYYPEDHSERQLACCEAASTLGILGI